MPQISSTSLNHYRAQTFKTAPGMHLAGIDDAVQYVNERSFIFFWPFKGIGISQLVDGGGRRPPGGRCA